MNTFKNLNYVLRTPSFLKDKYMNIFIILQKGKADQTFRGVSSVFLSFTIICLECSN